MEPQNSGYLLEARDVGKTYGAVRALSGVSFGVRPGEVLGLVGDNGAGKSTMIGVLSGSTQPSSGRVAIDGVEQNLGSPHKARDLGIETVFQDLALAPDVSVSDNLFIGREMLQRKLGWLGWLDRRRMEAHCAAELSRLSVNVPSVKAPCRSLSGGQRQAVAIARAVVWSSKVLLLDEPTAALGVEQQAKVGQLMRAAADRSLGVIVISHNLPQVLDVCDRIVVLWRGRLVANIERQDFDLNRIVQWITGAAVKEAS